MKLEVGMYVRTKQGLIAKYIGYEKNDDDIQFNTYNFDGKIYWYYEYYNDFVYEEDFKYWFEERVLKTSHNIVEILEAGDLLDFHCIEKIEGKTIYLTDGWFIDFEDVEDMVETIVTKEQFESMSYKVGE